MIKGDHLLSICYLYICLLITGQLSYICFRFTASDTSFVKSGLQVRQGKMAVKKKKKTSKGKKR